MFVFQRLIETASWGDDPASIEQNVLSHQSFHSANQRSAEVDQAREDLVGSAGTMPNVLVLQTEVPVIPVFWEHITNLPKDFIFYLLNFHRDFRLASQWHYVSFFNYKLNQNNKSCKKEKRTYKQPTLTNKCSFSCSTCWKWIKYPFICFWYIIENTKTGG